MQTEQNHTCVSPEGFPSPLLNASSCSLLFLIIRFLISRFLRFLIRFLIIRSCLTWGLSVSTPQRFQLLPSTVWAVTWDAQHLHACCYGGLFMCVWVCLLALCVQIYVVEVFVVIIMSVGLYVHVCMCTCLLLWQPVCVLKCVCVLKWASWVWKFACMPVWLA